MEGTIYRHSMASTNVLFCCFLAFGKVSNTNAVLAMCNLSTSIRCQRDCRTTALRSRSSSQRRKKGAKRPESHDQLNFKDVFLEVDDCSGPGSSQTLWLWLLKRLDGVDHGPTYGVIELQGDRCLLLCILGSFLANRSDFESFARLGSHTLKVEEAMFQWIGPALKLSHGTMDNPLEGTFTLSFISREGEP